MAARHTSLLRNATRALSRTLIALSFALSLFAATAAAAQAQPKALILGSTVTGGPSLEQKQAEVDGFSVTVASDPQWEAMTAADFRAYQVLIIGDPTCSSNVQPGSTAYRTQATWELAVMSSAGNKVLIGTDPVFHQGVGPGPTSLIRNGIAYAGTVVGATGLYLDLSCTYDGSSPGTQVPILNGLSAHGSGQFTVTGEGSIGACATAVNIVASTGPTAGLTDGELSHWNCSVHEAFDRYPADYTPLAVAPASSGFSQSFCGTDVETGARACGSPYVLISGTGISQTPVCPSIDLLAATGSGQYFNGSTNLGVSPQLSRVREGMETVLKGSGISIGTRVIDYPADSVSVLSSGLLDVLAFPPPLWGSALIVKLQLNARTYIAGKNEGLFGMRDAFLEELSKCPHTRIVPIGYSQGAMVVHEFLTLIAKVYNSTAQRAIRAAVLIADPERVKNSAVTEFSDAPSSGEGVCGVVSALVTCPFFLHLEDIPSMFLSRTRSVCAHYDGVCDTSDAIVRLAKSAPWNWSSEVNQSFSIIHASYKSLLATREAGENVARHILVGG